MQLSERIINWIDCEVGEILEHAQSSPDMEIYMYQNRENSWCIVAQAKGLNYFSPGLSTFNMDILAQITDFFLEKKFTMTIDMAYVEKGFLRKKSKFVKDLEELNQESFYLVQFEFRKE